MACVQQLNRIYACEQIRELEKLPLGEEVVLGYCGKSGAMLRASRYDSRYIEFTHRNATGERYYCRLPFNWQSDDVRPLLDQALAIVKAQASCRDVYNTPHGAAICKISD